MKNKTLIFCFLFTAAFVGNMHADNMIRYVSLSGSSTSPYTNWAMAATNFADGVDATPNGGILNVSSGCYYATRDINVSSKTIMINSVFGAEHTVYDGGNQKFDGLQANVGSVVYIDGITFTNFNDPLTTANRYPLRTASTGKLCLESCVVGGCTGSDASAVMVAVQGSLYATNCVFKGNTATRTGLGGGAVSSVYAVEVVLVGCQFFDNTAAGGGGGVSGDKLMISNCVFSGNSSPYGGAIRVYSGTNAVLYGCTIIGNSSSEGAGVYVRQNASARIYNCTITHNDCTGYRGGGIYVGSGSATLIRNCLIAHNNTTLFANAGHGGAGVYMMAGTNTVENCTIVSNSVPYNGGGILLNVGTGEAGIINSIVYFNSNPSSLKTSNFCGNASLAGWTNSLTAPVPTGASVINVNTANPLLEDFKPVSSSPCINAGLYESWMDNARDIDGSRRIDRVWGKPDIGAYEYLPTGMLFQGM